MFKQNVVLVLMLTIMIIFQISAQEPSAAVFKGEVVEINPQGKFVFIKVTSTQPEGAAKPGDKVKIMVNWGRNKAGKIAPLATEVAKFKAFKVGQQIELPGKIDKKWQGYRLITAGKIEEINSETKKVTETMVIPDKPSATDPSVIKGADLKKLQELAAGEVETINVAVGDNLISALKKARKLLEQGKAVKVKLAEGTHKVTEAKAVTIGGGKAKDPLFILEGAGKEKTIIDFQLPAKARSTLNINNKYNVIFRNFRMTNHPTVPIHIGIYSPMQDNKNFLMENLSFEKCHTGMNIFHIDSLTICNVDSKNNQRSGIFLICRNAIVENCVFTGNQGAGPGSFRGGIALAARNILIKKVICDNNKPKGAGIRMDHACENVIIEDSSFCRNNTGTVWETAFGPCLIRNSKMNDNIKNGIVLATAYNFTLDGCEIRNNGKMQFEISCKPRPVLTTKPKNVKTAAFGTSDFSVKPGVKPYNLRGMMGNRFLTVKNCIVTTKTAKQPLYGHQYGKPNIYIELFTKQFTANNNTYFCEDSTKAFDDFQGPYKKFNLVDLQAWQKWTGQEKNSVWKNPQE